jgi:hypothetical protein
MQNAIDMPISTFIILLVVQTFATTRIDLSLLNDTNSDG